MRRIPRSVISVVAVALAATVIAGCGGATVAPGGTSGGGAAAAPGVTADTITLGMVTPLTGQFAALGVDGRAGAEALIATVNDAGGINGRKLALSVQDDQYDPKQAVAGARYFASQEPVLGIWGNNGTATTLAGLPTLQQSGVPLLFPMALSTKLAEYDKSFASMLTLSGQFNLYSNWIATQPDQAAAKWGILYQNDGTSAEVVDGFKKGKTPVTADATFERAATTYAPQLQRLQQAGITNVVFIGNANQLSVTLKEADQTGFKLKWTSSLGNTGPDLAKLVGPLAEGVVTVNPYAPPRATCPAPTSSAPRWTSTSRARRRACSRCNSWVGGKIIVDALQRTGKDVTPRVVPRRAEQHVRPGGRRDHAAHHPLGRQAHRQHVHRPRGRDQRRVQVGRRTGVPVTPAPVVVVGAGLAGLATAVAAAERGHPVTVLEKGELAGGAAAFSGGQVWVAANHLEERQGIADDLDDAESYVRAIGEPHPELVDDAALRRWLTEAPRAAKWFEDAGAVRWEIIPDYPDYYQNAPGARATGRYLTAVYDATRLGEWRARMRVSPHFPRRHDLRRMLGAGLRASAFGTAREAGRDRAGGPLVVRHRAWSRGSSPLRSTAGVEILLEHAAVDLVIEDGRVTGVVAATAVPGRGRSRAPSCSRPAATTGTTTSRASTSGLEPDERGSVAPRTLTGDGLRLAAQAGGAVASVPANRVPVQLGYPVEGYPGFQVAREHSLPHTFVVDSDGQAVLRRRGLLGSDQEGAGAGQPAPAVLHDLGLPAPRPLWAGPHPAGRRSTRPASWRRRARWRSSARLLGIDGAELARTAATFTADVEQGSDPAFGRGTNTTWQRFQGDPNQRPHPNLGGVAEPPFFGMRLTMVSTGIGLDAASPWTRTGRCWTRTAAPSRACTRGARRRPSPPPARATTAASR